MKISPVHISNFMVDGGAMFGVVPKLLWKHKYPPNEDNLVNLSLRSLLVDNGSELILIDTGYGDKQNEKFFRHAYLNGGDGLIEGIEKAGYRPDDISDIVLTHLHADHCGGVIKKSESGDTFELTFPNANIWVSRIQWEWAIEPNLREAGAFLEENILPIKDSGRLNLVDEEGELFKGFSVKIVNGHTPGQIIPVIDYNGTRLVYAADLFPTIAHLPLIWNMSYDIDQLTTIREKEAILSEALENEYILYFQHDLNVECCSLKQTPKGIREDQTFKFSEISS